MPGVSPEATGAFAGRVLAGLLLARVDGKSPVEYLTRDEDRDRVRAIARRGLTSPVAGPEDLIADVERGIGHDLADRARARARDPRLPRAAHRRG